MGRSLRESVGEREREVLRAVVENHVGNSAPVGSRTLSRNALSDLGLSPATIRNIMADLDEMGLVEKPHSSAGRVPTDSGYRFYVEELMTAKPMPLRHKRLIEGFLERGMEETGDIMEVSSRLLARLSHQAGVILFPKITSGPIEKIHFIKISAYQIQVVLVTAAGRAQNLAVDLEENLREHELVELSNFLNHEYPKRTLLQIRHELLEDISSGNEHMLKLKERALAINEKLVLRKEAADVVVEGTTTLIDVPEFRNDAKKLKKLLKLLSDKKKLLSILDKCLDGRQVSIEIGSGIEDAGLDDCAIVARSYGQNDAWDGAIGVIGPRRMDYPYVVGLVEYLSNTLSKKMREGRE